MKIYQDEFPDVKFAYKHDPPKGVRVFFVLWFVKLVGFFDSAYSVWFHTRVVTVVGDWILFPPSHDWTQEDPDYSTFKILVHELRHLRQRRDNRFWELRYLLFPLPAIWTERGYRWEFEAYSDSMWCDMFFVGFLLVPITTRANSFTSKDYIWMSGFTKSATDRVRANLVNVLELIKTGNYSAPSSEFISPLGSKL